MPKFAVGDTALKLESRYRNSRVPVEPIEVTITRVGRKYAYISLYGGSQEQGFDMETGAGTGEHGYPDYLFTPEGWQDHKRREYLVDALKRQGIEFRSYSTQRETTTLQMERILAILEEPPKTP